MEQRRLICQLDDRFAAHRHDAMLGLAAQPVAVADRSFAQVRIVFCLKPQLSTAKASAHVVVRRPEPEDTIRVRDGAAPSARRFARSTFVGTDAFARCEGSSSRISYGHGGSATMTRYGPRPGSGGGSARIASACRHLEPLETPFNAAGTIHVGEELAERSGSASAAATTASAFSSVRCAMPTACAALSGARPFEASGNLPGIFAACLAALALTLLRCLSLDRFQRPLDGDGLGQREILAIPRSRQTRRGRPGRGRLR